LPVPATFIIEQDAEILYAFVNADYTQRLEPAEIVAQLAAMPTGRVRSETVG